MSSDLKPAVWVGPFVAELANSTSLVPGSEYMVSEEDLKSAHWQPVKPPRPHRHSAHAAHHAHPEPPPDTPAEPDVEEQD